MSHKGGNNGRQCDELLTLKRVFGESGQLCTNEAPFCNDIRGPLFGLNAPEIRPDRRQFRRRECVSKPQETARNFAIFRARFCRSIVALVPNNVALLFVDFFEVF